MNLVRFFWPAYLIGYTLCALYIAHLFFEWVKS